jgi:hypothetical protein
MKKLTLAFCVLLGALAFGGCANGYGYPHHYGYGPGMGHHQSPQTYYRGGYQQPYYGGGYGHGHHGDDD